MHRSEQIAELLKGFDYDVVDITVKLSGEGNPLLSAIKGRSIAQQFGLQLALSHASWFAKRIEATRNFLKEHHECARLVILESHQDYPVAIAAWLEGCKVIALPHNLESFCQKTDLAGAGFHQSFQNELTILKRCDAVFPIAYEEAWLLKLRGINSTTLPYRSPSSLTEELRFIRQNRTQFTPNTDAPFLILGSAINAFSKAGMEELLAWLKDDMQSARLKLDIAGYGTEQLSDSLPKQANIHLHGAVNSEQRNTLMANCRALLVHQISGAGALTRIVEALDAGVPVIANRMASRSAHYKGVHVYDDPVGLHNMINTTKPLEVCEPAPDIFEPIHQLQAQIQQCLS